MLLDYHLLEGVGDQPPRLVPVHQPDPLHPWGAPPTWQVLAETVRPSRPWLWRSTAGLVSLAAGVATFVSETVSTFVAHLVATTGETVVIAGHVIGLACAEDRLGSIGRLLSALGLALALGRLAWRRARAASRSEVGR